MGQGFGIFINFCNSWTELPHAAPVIEAQEARKRMRISSHPQRTHFQSLAIVRFGFDVSRLAKVLRWLAYVDLLSLVCGAGEAPSPLFAGAFTMCGLAESAELSSSNVVTICCNAFGFTSS